MKQENFMFKLIAHPQDASLCICNYSEIQTVKYFWLQEYQLRDN